jgi:hypothetical protein
MRSLPYVLVCSLLLAPAASAEPSKRHESKHSRYTDEHRRGQAYYFSPNDVRVIHEYYGPRYRTLPPGLQKKYYRTGHLPPGWQRKLQPLPIGVERRLAPLPPYYRRGVIDGYVVAYEPRSQVIVDVTALFPRR